MSSAKQDCLMLLLKFFLFISPTMHPSMSAVPSHTLSVFHRSISKPDPRVNSVPPPPRLAQPITTCPGGIPNMQLSDPSFAEPSIMRCEYAGVSIETNMVQLFHRLPFNIIFQPSFFTRWLFAIHLNLLPPPSVIQPLSVSIVGHSAGSLGCPSQDPFLPPSKATKL